MRNFRPRLHGWLHGHSSQLILLLGMLVIVLLVWIFEPRLNPPPAPPPELPITVLGADGELLRLDIEEFLIGVVAAEMPASFKREALQAQAIAARSYIVAHTPPYGAAKHGEAVVCCDSACCQAYCDEAQQRAKWGEDYEDYRQKIAAAVRRSAGQILVYQGQVAQTPYCAVCGGSTEAAGDCWSVDIAYLQAAACGYCEHAPRYTSALVFELEQAAELLDCRSEELYTMSVDAYSAGGRVAELTLGGRSWRGTELRAALGLNSAAFAWLILGGDIVFVCVGHGHGVGLCQYGADGMAAAGFSADEIALKYYNSCTLTTIEAMLAQ
ncbi:MAG: stage II sporulation protein D [Bacillota bacterium]|nr:stage II sporulation protein D [Bacillota bacterium]